MEGNCRASADCTFFALCLSWRPMWCWTEHSLEWSWGWWLSLLKPCPKFGFLFSEEYCWGVIHYPPKNLNVKLLVWHMLLLARRMMAWSILPAGFGSCLFSHSESMLRNVVWAASPERCLNEVRGCLSWLCWALGVLRAHRLSMGKQPFPL